MATSSGQQHWLIGVAGRARLGDLRDMRLSLDTPPTQAWEQTATWLEVSQEALAEHVATTFRMKVADLGSAEPEAARVLPEADAQRLLVLPLRATDRTLVLATADPLDADAEREIAFVSGRTAEFEISPPGPLSDAIGRAYRSGEADDFVATTEALQEAARLVAFVGEPSLAPKQDPEGKASAGVELSSLILLEAVKAEAEVVMIGPMAAGGRVRFQTDGELHTFMRVPRSTLSGITSFIEALADIEETADAESSGTRTGEIQVQVRDLDYVVRISTTTEGDADKMVLWLTEVGASVAAGETETAPDEAPAAPTTDEEPWATKTSP